MNVHIRTLKTFVARLTTVLLPFLLNNIYYDTKRYIPLLLSRYLLYHIQFFFLLVTYEKIKKCEFPGCNAEFTKRFQLRWHKASHEKSAHPCSVCQTVFDSLPALEKHKDRVHESK